MRCLVTSSACVSALLLAGCGQASSQEEKISSPAAPDIAMTAVEGVAYEHSYTLRLPPARIAGVQEQHAAACEKLGPERCRISAFDYAVSDQGQVSASLVFRLAPPIARSFARQGIAQAVAADGMLTRASITGVEAGAALAAAREDAGGSAVDAATAAADARTARTAAERIAARDERAAATAAAGQRREAIRKQQALLASTPVRFDYDPGQRIARFAGDGPLSGVLDLSLWVVQAVIRIIAILIAVLLPFAVLGGIGWLVVRTARRRWPQMTG